ncbi:probable disease resistance protein At1g12290 [Hevea brasiliensis]|uniref:probable disease resistance protein At1g12290 n=1 Tax=Hevea brasiliensis TaxID=3981 RepID=UPI0025F7B049|nr:probable disease resistance protein At1g12290 [Hevea brasiliensis]
MHIDLIHHLEKLSDDDCWSILVTYAFHDEIANSSHSAYEAIGKEIAKKCRGLPLALKTIGSLLRSKRDVKEWEKILQSNMWDLLSDNMIPALKLSYHYLASHLKQCFAYCATFPKGYEFYKEDLVRIWIAEVFVVDAKDDNSEDVGDEYLNYLGCWLLLELLINIGRSSGSSIKELGKLPYIRGHLRFENLQNVNPEDVWATNLRFKENPKTLEFKCGGKRKDSKHARSVLEQLWPHEKVESLSIVGYEGFKEVVSVGSEFYGSYLPPMKPFGSLIIQRFERLEKWEEWKDENDAFPLLEELYVIKYPRLTKAVPSNLPCLKKLVECRKQLAPSLQVAPNIYVVDFSSMVKFNKLPSGLYHLELNKLNSVNSVMEGIEEDGLSSSLEEIVIRRRITCLTFGRVRLVELQKIEVAA